MVRQQYARTERLAPVLIIGLGAGIFEEVGWTGFATPRLLRRYSWFATGAVLGVPWAVWHALPDYLVRRGAVHPAGGARGHHGQRE